MVTFVSKRYAPFADGEILSVFTSARCANVPPLQRFRLVLKVHTPPLLEMAPGSAPQEMVQLFNGLAATGSPLNPVKVATSITTSSICRVIASLIRHSRVSPFRLHPINRTGFPAVVQV